MRTTIEISDELLERVRAAAALRGESLGDFILRAIDARLGSTTRPERFGWRSVFGLVESKAIEEVDAIISAEFEQVHPSEWR